MTMAQLKKYSTVNATGEYLHLTLVIKIITWNFVGYVTSFVIRQTAEKKLGGVTIFIFLEILL